MNLFYIRHHYLSIVRSKSFDGEIFAFIILTLIFVGPMALTYAELDVYAAALNDFFSQPSDNHYLFLISYVWLDLAIRLVFRRPFPKLKYYVLWRDQSKTIAPQYLFTSLFGIMPYVLFISMLMMATKAFEWFGWYGSSAIVLWWLSNHFLCLTAQFAGKGIKIGIALTVITLLLVQYLLPTSNIASALINPVVPAFLLLLLVFVSYRLVLGNIENRVISDEKKTSGILDSLPVLSFKNPVFQLEWALLIRNKRTRSNLLLGLVSVLLLPFLVDSDTEWMIGTLVFFITTGFFIIQHGMYSLGWEGSYFDFLVSNISPKVFIKTRYLFYLGTCVIGLILASISTFIRDLSWINLVAIFLYNVGVTIPLVLYRSTLNDTKIVLTENSFMNYNGMITGPIFVTSFLVTLLPLFIYGIGQPLLGEHAVYLLGVLGGVGLVFFHPITDLIARKYHQKKYHLSQSFKS
ncbi:DUF5687 family protein [Ekhidna sp.]|uniref:DUF5687 family protein n=1 Tax=Ekhidna sp. TaxID=2608089 RepID=UPI003B5B90EF